MCYSVTRLTRIDAQANIRLQAVTGDFGLRVAADYRRVVVGGDRSDENEYRCILGIVLPFGK